MRRFHPGYVYCDLLIEIGGRMDEVRESCHEVFQYPINTAVRNQSGFSFRFESLRVVPAVPRMLKYR